jgi:pimeloyl-ACP methyl ester carboxylesterase
MPKPMSELKRADVTLHYELSGHGPPVLFIQGVGVCGEGWRPQVSGLQGHFQTLMFDNRGIGRSLPCHGGITIEAMAEDARALLDVAGWKSAHVVGHSMGGVIAQQLALDCPKRVRSLSLLCTFARGKDAARLTPWVLWMTLRTRIGSRRMRRRAFLEMLMPREELRTVNREELAAHVASLIGRDLADQPPILLKQLRAMSRHDCLPRLSELAPIPTLVVSAQHDRIALPRYGRRLVEAISGARYEEIPAASHGVIMQKAGPINSLLERFFNSIEIRDNPGALHG